MVCWGGGVTYSLCTWLELIKCAGRDLRNVDFTLQLNRVGLGVEIPYIVQGNCFAYLYRNSQTTMKEMPAHQHLVSCPCKF